MKTDARRENRSGRDTWCDPNLGHVSLSHAGFSPSATSGSEFKQIHCFESTL